MNAGVAKQPEWTEVARAELAAGIAFIAQDNPAAALLVWERLEHAAELLAEHPRMGRAGAFPGTREFPVNRATYTLIYRETPKGIEILHVMHQRQVRPLGLN